MSPDKKSTSSTNENTPADKTLSIGGDVVDSVVISGDNNTTFFQKVIKIFKSDSETLEHRNRRILLGHVENAWTIKKESTDKTFPAGLSMQEIFDGIGIGRSVLILARQLIERAREDLTESIPMVFNLASWTEKLTLADWLAQELNNLYSVPARPRPIG